MQKIFDISIPVSSETVTWEGDEKVRLHRVLKMEEGAQFNLSSLSMSVHNGTHIDAPYHFLPDGATVDKIPLDILIGPAQVIEVKDKGTLIGADALKSAGIGEKIKRLLIKTRNSDIWKANPNEFQQDFVSINKRAAEYLVDLSIVLIGIDYLSISPADNFQSVHKILMSAGIIILETIDLSEVSPGFYDLYCLPLKLQGVEGAPVRAVLLQG
ncbi:MAG TPA: cyclase family protein [Anaerolineae bacterium]|nr:cyclase family protein [Anaerolineae bacterium]